MSIIDIGILIPIIMIRNLLKFWKIKKAWLDINSSSLSNRENLSLIKVESNINIFLSNFGNDLRRVNIYRAQRVSSSYKGEIPIKEENWRIKDFLPLISVDKKTGSFLLALIRRLRPKRVLEVGSGYGVSAIYILAGLTLNQCGKLICVEQSDYYISYLEKNFQLFGVDRWKIVKGDAIKVVGSDLLINYRPFDLIFVDACHQREFNFDLYAKILENTVSCCCIVIDDINWTPLMTEFWNKIKNHKKVYEALDCGRFGVLLLS